MTKKILNFGWGDITTQWNEAEQQAPVEMMVYDSIGRDPWDGGGITSDDFRKALNDVPKGRDLKVRVNSKGGDVHEGMAIMNLLNEFPGRVTTVIDGVAASTASWAFISPADEVQAPKSSQIFIHDAITYGYGNAEDLRQAADRLDKTSDQIAAMYAEKTGKGKKTMRDMMRDGDGTLLTGEEAEELGLVDTLIESRAIRNFTPAELVSMKDKLRACYNAARTTDPKEPKPGHKTGQTMNKQLIIAMLNKHGVTEWEGKPISAETSEEHLQAALNKVLNDKDEAATKLRQKDSSAPTLEQLTELQNQIKGLTELNNKAKTDRITRAIDQLIIDDKLTASERPAALKRAIADETYLDELTARPAMKLGGDPINNRAQLVGEAFGDVQNYLLANGPRFMSNFIGNKTQEGKLGERTLKEIRDRAVIVANTISQHKKMLVQMFDTNSIDPGLQRQVILQEMLEEFAVVITQLQTFSAVFSNVPLEGTDVVDVPFYPLDNAAGVSFNAANGYNTTGDTATQVRQVKVGGKGDVTVAGANAAAGTCMDRKYIGAAFSSYEMARQPYLNVQKLMNQKANRLGVLIFQDFVSRVICKANFGNAVKSVPPAQFSADDIADLCEVATGANWPAQNRSLTLDHKYRTPLLKDPTFKQYLSYGSTDPLRKALIQEAYGFENIPIIPNLSTYSPQNEYLVGWINWMYAALFATAPIMPTSDVRALMTRYDIVTDPKSGVTFEYRRFGNVVLDQTSEFIECSYGGNVGVADALFRIVSQGQ